MDSLCLIEISRCATDDDWRKCYLQISGTILCKSLANKISKEKFLPISYNVKGGVGGGGGGGYSFTRETEIEASALIPERKLLSCQC